eukprot:TRINITY_DN11120_c0_g1_i1.p1 TRINITY_DN11120_c0_g1~~TRINITY_DN11120_c0_g1_i1.p1  ORF type:complete len:306 (+),score=128.83 TRINITY_DN11120_c0_g1_i1:123-1040(+)
METPWFKKWAKQASDAIENARVTIEDNVTKNQPHVESMLRHLGDNVASAAQNIQRNLAGDPTTRGPLTEAEIDSLDMVYLTPRIIASAYPINRSLGAPRQPVAQGNPIELMAALLHQSHQGRYMVWNISEESYDYAYFQDQVLEFRFPGHPAPPLGMLFNICTSIENWLEADPANVAVVHCLTGRGRTATVLACLLAWLGAAAAAPGEALACVSAADAASHEPAAALAAPAAAFELSALDELEKELGIASLGAGGSTEAPAAAAAAMAAEEEFDLGGDDFDGFESYLESLAGGGGGGGGSKAEGT